VQNREHFVFLLRAQLDAVEERRTAATEAWAAWTTETWTAKAGTVRAAEAWAAERWLAWGVLRTILAVVGTAATLFRAAILAWAWTAWAWAALEVTFVGIARRTIGATLHHRRTAGVGAVLVGTGGAAHGHQRQRHRNGQQDILYAWLWVFHSGNPLS
jgi:hypothetical protein